jgi:iron complex outermembrane recepter protein
MHLKRDGLVVVGVIALGVGASAAASDSDSAPDAAMTADAAAPAAADAAAGPDSDAGDLSSVNEVIVTGTRVTGIKAVDSAAPIQVIASQSMERAAGKPDLVTTLSNLIPSLTAQAFGSDQANQTLQAKLRGLSPNDVLVLIDGKRRHTTSNLAVIGGPYQGGAGVDLNFIPVDAIDHVEVLTDGAAAQYGSDAIAGVINIILKKTNNGGNLGGTYGEYYDGGGITGQVQGNIGFEPIPGGYLNLTAEVRNHGHSFRGGLDGRTLNPNLTFPDSNMVNVPGYPNVNLISGDAEYHSKIFSFNAGTDITDGIQLYSFGSYGDKKAQSYENYRTPSTVSYQGPLSGGVKVYLFPLGFSPLEATRETDYDLTAGLKGELDAWNWDLSGSYGYNKVRVYTLNSANTAIAGGYTDITGAVIPGTNSTPRDFYDGFFKATQMTANIDINRDVDIGLAGPLNVAFGGEYRRSAYAIGAGDPNSYIGSGAQSYPGFQPADASIHSRKNYAGYVDFSAKPIDQLRVDLAGRFEHYDDFGSKTVGKLTARYDVIPEFGIRGTVSTGFRAPTLAEEYYRATNVSPDSATVQLQPNSKSAADLGLGALKPETSRNYSVGLAMQPLPGITATIDAYWIDINDRVVASGTLNSVVNGQLVSPAIATAIADSGAVPPSLVVPGGSYSVSLFTNGIDTRTKGVDFVLDAPFDYGWSKLDATVGASYSETTIRSIHNSPAQLAGQAPFATGSALFDQAALSDLTTASPKYVLNFGAYWTAFDRFSASVHEIIYGTTQEYQSDTGKTPAGAVSQVTYWPNTVGVTPITNVELSLQATKMVKLSIGANNAFNRYPNKVNPILRQGFAATYNRSTTTLYPAISPFGINGGFYYIKGELDF